MITRISQSFIKDYRSHKARELCGNVVREKWINGRLLSDPDNEDGTIDAMQLGSFWEYFLSLLIAPFSPSLPKDGKVPVAQFKKVKGRDVTDMRKPYQLAVANAKATASYFQEWGFQVLFTQKALTKGKYGGALDLICEATREIELDGVSLKAGERFIIDLKYSGLFSETTPKWNKHGWKWSEVQKEYHGTQAIQYHYIGGGEMKFFFLVVNSKNGDGECKFFYVPVGEWETEQHLIEGNKYFDDLAFYDKTGMPLKIYPDFLRCRKCPLRNECKDKYVYPRAEVVNLNED